MQEYLGFGSYQKDCFFYLGKKIGLSNQVLICCLANSFPAIEVTASGQKINFGGQGIFSFERICLVVGSKRRTPIAYLPLTSKLVKICQ